MKKVMMLSLLIVTAGQLHAAASSEQSGDADLFPWSEIKEEIQAFQSEEGDPVANQLLKEAILEQVDKFEVATANMDFEDAKEYLKNFSRKDNELLERYKHEQFEGATAGMSDEKMDAFLTYSPENGDASSDEEDISEDSEFSSEDVG